MERREREGVEAKESSEQERAAQEAEARQMNEEREREVAQKATEREAEGEAERKAGEEAERKSSEAEAARCVVPSLKGHSLSGARRALMEAGCKLGRVSLPHGAHGALVVTRQSSKRGTKLGLGAAVAVTMGPRKR